MYIEELYSIASDRFRYEYKTTNSTFMIITSTSWTPDEDFQLFLSAISILDQYLSFVNSQTTIDLDTDKTYMNLLSDCIQNYECLYSRALVVITGKGPLRSHYEDIIKNMNLNYISIQTIWLSSADYFSLLSCSDVGVCLHTSTSGFDLPMKVLDMLGGKLVVLAARYYAINELIRHEENGLLFSSSDELAKSLIKLMCNPRIKCDNNENLRLLHQQANNLSVSDRSQDLLHITSENYSDMNFGANTTAESSNGLRQFTSRDFTESISPLEIEVLTPLQNQPTELLTQEISSVRRIRSKELMRLRECVINYEMLDWNDNWSKVMGPVIHDIANAVVKEKSKEGKKYFMIWLLLLISMILVSLAYLSRHMTRSLST